MNENGKAILILVVVVSMTVAGAALVLQLLADRPVQEATVAGMFLRLDRAEWLLDQMDHSERYPMPDSMIPGLPSHSVMRLAVEVGLHNSSADTQLFRPTELFFRSSERGMWPATGGELRKVNLAPGQALNMFTYFDVAEQEIRGDLRLLWVRDGRTMQMLSIGHPPEHEHQEDEFAWPAEVAELPRGDAAAGESLFLGASGCASCHGDPRIPASHTVGPHLAGIASSAGERVAGLSAEQYLYESILDPDAHIAQGCKIGPCQTPSAMPPFGDLLTYQSMPDLIAYLLALQSPPDAPSL